MKISLGNDACQLSVESFGGAIVDFHLKDASQINPLSFAFAQEQMPENNKTGAPYRGHFLCAGRWGPPSPGEIRKAIPNHGEPANIQWQADKNENCLLMHTIAPKEALQVERKIEIDQQLPLFAVSECFTNINLLGRLYNVVQHPTLAAPFLNSSTIINGNATIGFNQAQYQQAEQNSFHFPAAADDKGKTFHLSNPQTVYNSVFSFVIEKENKIGWLTAYSPMHNLLLGYLWKRSDYPWIHLWHHWDNDQLLYCGIEFGTAGIHQPFREIINTATELFGEKTFAYIDAGECVCKQYFSFIYKTEQNFTGTESISVAGNCIHIRTKENKTIQLTTSINSIYELSK